MVYNHTAEGNHLGPTLSFRGIDNASYYRLVGDDPQYYMDTTGTGNSLLMRHPHVLQMIMDSLRYWVTEMHVDGFRFDLAAALARQFHEVDRLSAFFDMVQQDPIVSQVKLIAEPWDVGEGGYQVGNFPPLWTEWNGKYRDTVRDFWRGEHATLPEFASRLTGSSDLYLDDGRRPVASVNFVTAHDGFTLADLVSYNHKHNEANGEDNRDGTDDNRSWNCGVEGPTDDPAVTALRDRQKRNFLSTLLLSQGVPMLLGGDEMGRTQHGNNNAYCQDNEISWVHWPPSPDEAIPEGYQGDQELLDFVRRLLRLRADHPVFRRRRFFSGQAVRGKSGGPDQPGDIVWFTPAGEEMTDDDWAVGFAKSLTVFLNGDAITEPDPRGERIRDESFLLLFNASELDLEFTIPPQRYGDQWVKVLDTALPLSALADAPAAKPGDAVAIPSRSMQVLGRVYWRGRAPGRPPTGCSSSRASGSPAPPPAADYLADLGVTHVYLSPILQATPGSTHGYDVVDHSLVSEELGGEAAFRAMAAPVPRPRARRDRGHRAQPHGRPGARVAQPAAVVGAAGRHRLAVRGLVRRGLGRAGRPAADAGPGRPGQRLPRGPETGHQRRRAGAPVLRPCAARCARAPSACR